MGQRRRNSNEGMQITFWSALLSLATAMSVGVGAGYFVGSRFPKGLDPEVSEEVTIRPQATAGLDSPIPSEVYSFYDMLDTPAARPGGETGQSGAGEATAPAIPEPAEPLAVDEVQASAEQVEPTVTTDEPSAIEEQDEVREVARVVPPPAPPAEQERAQEREMAANAAPSVQRQPEPEPGSTRTISRTVVRSPTVARSAVASGGTIAASAEPTTWTASRGMTRVLADALTRDFRGAGLVADTQASSDGLFEVVVRLTGSDDDQARQRALAERINRSGN